MEITRAKFIIAGHVQGVGFRYFVYRNAISLGLTGFVRNVFDGTVEVVCEGNRDSIEKLRKILNKGPSMSRVEKVKVLYETATSEFSEFNIRH